jgi:hypothetical protein
MQLLLVSCYVAKLLRRVVSVLGNLAILKILLAVLPVATQRGERTWQSRSIKKLHSFFPAGLRRTCLVFFFYIVINFVFGAVLAAIA